MQNEAHQSHLTVSENGAGRYQQTIRAGRHELIADEPVSAGGNDAGLEYERYAAGMLTDSEDRREGFRAFVEKRKPVYVGR